MFALLLALASPVFQEPQILQPKTYVSPSGEWRLSVDPSSKLGDGPASVSVTHRGVEAWQAELPYTYWKATITDAGYAAGYAFTAGPIEIVVEGEFVVAIIAPDGSTLLEERVERTLGGSPHAPSNPRVLGAFAQPMHDHFVVRIGDPVQDNELWWSYRISTGESLGRAHPKDRLQDPAGLAMTLDARAIGGTPLTLVQWYHYVWDTRADRELGTRFVLVDSDWRPVWELALPRDFQHPDTEKEDSLLGEMFAQGGILAASTPRRFELRHVTEQQRVTYEVSADPKASTGWSVQEVARAPFVAAQVEALPVLELLAIASVPLGAGAPSDANRSHDSPTLLHTSRRPAGPNLPQEADGVHFDGRGRVALVDRRSHAVHLYSARGERELVLMPHPADFDESHYDVGAVTTTAGGQVYVHVNYTDDRHLCFAADGQRVGEMELGGERVAFLASGARWAARRSLYEEAFVQRIEPDGTVRAKVARRPSNAFFEQIEAIGCAPDGALAVLSSTAAGFELDLFDAHGAPQRTLELHGALDEYWDHLVYTRRWIIVSSFVGEALLISLPDGQASLVRPAVGAEGTLYAFDLSPDGQELWCATLEPPALRRFLLPE
jgi:hypothetical protein